MAGFYYELEEIGGKKKAEGGRQKKGFTTKEHEGKIFTGKREKSGRQEAEGRRREAK
jgi:hypothetical protein